MARAIVQLKLAEPCDALQLVRRDKPTPSPGQVLVRITVRPINPTDLVNIRNGGVPKLPYHQPPVMGCEGFGIVEEIGSGVTKFTPGQRVIPLVYLQHHRTGQGSWQDYMVLSEDDIVAVPESVSDEAASQFFLNPWTLYGILDDIAVPKGEYILQTAAGSVLGRQVIQLAKHWGIKTINIVRRDKLKEELKALGADEVINSETEDIAQRVHGITSGKLAYAAIDAVGGTLTKMVAASVRDEGIVLIYGVLSSWNIEVRTIDLFRGVQVKGWFIFNYISKQGKKNHVCGEVMKLFEEKVITPAVGKKFPLEDFLAAIEESEKESRGGKVLLIS